MILPPHIREAVVDSTGSASRPWHTWARSITDLVNEGVISHSDAASAIRAIALALGSPDGSVEKIPPAANGADYIISGPGSVSVFGTPGSGKVEVTLRGDGTRPGAGFVYGTGTDGDLAWRALFDYLAALPGITVTTDAFGTVSIGLADLADSGSGSLLAITRDAKGRVSGTKAATITGTAGRVTVANGDAAAGLPTIDLAPVADAGGGALLRIVRDGWGRVSGTSAATTTDLPEGTNLYFTDARARTASVADSITNGTTDIAPSQNAVSDALALKYDKTGGAVSGPVLASGLCASGANTAGATGPNMLMIVSGGIGYLQGYNFSTGLKIPFSISGSVIYVEATAEAQPDNSRDWGTASFRFANVYAKNLRPGDGTCIWTTGVGSPEGVIAAAVGSLYTRTDGGAGTTLYVKETGASNTGWVGK